MVLVDLKGSLKHSSPSGELYSDPKPFDLMDPSDESILWDSSSVQTVAEPKLEKPQFLNDLAQQTEVETAVTKNYNFIETVETWTDFMYSRYHPRSVHILNEYEHSTKENAFDCFTSGASTWKTDDFQDNYCDKIRQYIEECNSCQV